MAYSATPQPWVNSSDVEAAMPAGIPSDLEGVAALYVAQFAGEVESIANRPLHVVVVDEVAEVLDGLVLTQHRPVISVQSILYGGGAPTTGIRGGLVTIPSTMPMLGTSAYEATISYTARFSTTQLAGAKGIVVDRVKRMLVKEDDDAIGTDGSSEEGHSERYVAEGWTPVEREFIESLRRRVGA